MTKKPFPFPISPLVVPSSFNNSWTVEQQIIYLAEHKQGKLVAGDNITITKNEDGTYTISATDGSSSGSTYSIRQNPNPSSENVAEYYLQNLDTMEQSGATIAIPKINGIQSIVSVGGQDKVTVTITLTDGTTSEFDIPYGEDGYSPTASVTPISNGVRITITDKNGTTYEEVFNGTTPDITISASILPISGSIVPVGAPYIEVDKSGTAAAPHFDFKIYGLESGSSLPEGGNIGDVLKISNDDPYEYKWDKNYPIIHQSGSGADIIEGKGQVWGPTGMNGISDVSISYDENTDKSTLSLKLTNTTEEALHSIFMGASIYGWLYNTSDAEPGGDYTCEVNSSGGSFYYVNIIDSNELAVGESRNYSVTVDGEIQGIYQGFHISSIPNVPANVGEYILKASVHEEYSDLHWENPSGGSEVVKWVEGGTSYTYPNINRQSKSLKDANKSPYTFSSSSSGISDVTLRLEFSYGGTQYTTTLTLTNNGTYGIEKISDTYSVNEILPSTSATNWKFTNIKDGADYERSGLQLNVNDVSNIALASSDSNIVITKLRFKPDSIVTSGGTVGMRFNSTSIPVDSYGLGVTLNGSSFTLSSYTLIISDQIIFLNGITSSSIVDKFGYLNLKSVSLH